MKFLQKNKRNSNYTSAQVTHTQVNFALLQNQVILAQVVQAAWLATHGAWSRLPLKVPSLLRQQYLQTREELSKKCESVWLAKLVRCAKQEVVRESSKMQQLTVKSVTLNMPVDRSKAALSLSQSTRLLNHTKEAAPYLFRPTNRMNSRE